MSDHHIDKAALIKVQRMASSASVESSWHRIQKNGAIKVNRESPHKWFPSVFNYKLQQLFCRISGKRTQ